MMSAEMRTQPGNPNNAEKADSLASPQTAKRMGVDRPTASTYDEAPDQSAPDYTHLLRNYLSQLTGHRHNGLF